MQHIHIYSPKLSARLRYIGHQIFSDLMGLELHWSSDEGAWAMADGPKLAYSSLPLQTECFWIPAHTLLFDQKIKAQKIGLGTYAGLPCFFERKLEGADLPFDLLAMCFYLLSRYEEYLPYEADEHGRFPARESLGHRSGFLDRPLINLWAIYLGKAFSDKWSGLDIRHPQYRFRPTLDIDMAWAYRNKGLIRTLGGMTKDLLGGHYDQLALRIGVLLRFYPDPFDTFDYFRQVHETWNVTPIYFFLLGQRSDFDKNIDPRDPRLRQLIHRISQQQQVGLHPSYLSNDEERGEYRLQREKQELENIIARPVSQSRQHYVKLHLPQTYQRLIQAGIREDFSMGYASESGFRAAIATPFYWFDLQRNVATNLRVHPFQIMDVTLKQYRKLQPETTAREEILKIIKATREVGGQLVAIWHNSSLSGLDSWKEWKEVYEFLLDNAAP